MKLSDLTIEELECMGYDEIAQLILEETGKKQKLMDLFKKVCKLLKLDFDANTDNIGDFFELLSTNKKFIMLKNGYWDLQVNHKAKISVEDHDEEIIDIDNDENLEEDEQEENHDDIYYTADDTEDTVEDDLADLVVVDEDDEEASL